jgi:hypothetical protein
VSFLVTIGKINVSESRLKVMKANTYSVLILSMKDKLFRVVVDIDDPAEQWAKLATKYPAGDTSQCLMVLGKLLLIKMKEGRSMEDYFNTVEELRDQMAKMEEDIPNLILVHIVVNNLPESFKGMISSIFNMDKLTSYDVVSAKLKDQ